MPDCVEDWPSDESVASVTASILQEHNLFREELAKVGGAVSDFGATIAVLDSRANDVITTIGNREIEAAKAEIEDSIVVASLLGVLSSMRSSGTASYRKMQNLRQY